MNQSNPLNKNFEGGVGGDGNRQVIQAPAPPGGGVEDLNPDQGQVERPNVVPPMVNNNNQENQASVPSAYRVQFP